MKFNGDTTHTQVILYVGKCITSFCVLYPDPPMKAAPCLAFPLDEYGRVVNNFF